MTLPEGKPYVKGRWMVTGPENQDGTGWTLCLLSKGKCVKCIARFPYKHDAYKACRLYHNFDKPHNAMRELVNLINTQLHEHGIEMKFDIVKLMSKT